MKFYEETIPLILPDAEPLFISATLGNGCTGHTRIYWPDETDIATGENILDKFLGTGSDLKGKSIIVRTAATCVAPRDWAMVTHRLKTRSMSLPQKPFAEFAPDADGTVRFTITYEIN